MLRQRVGGMRFGVITGLVLFLMVVAVACGDEGVQVTIGPSDTPVPPTSTPVPPTPTPTFTPTPSPTPTPTPTATPTPTPTATPTPEPTATPTPEPTPEPAGVTAPDERDEPVVVDLDPITILEESSIAMEEIESFHFVMDAGLSTGSGGLSFDIPITMEGDFVSPDRSQGSINVNLGFFQIESQFINIGDESYSTDPDTGEWVLGGSNDFLFFDPTDFLGGGVFDATDDLEGVEGLELIDIEDLDGIDAYHLSFTFSDEMSDDPEALPGSLNFDLWIGVDDLYIHQIAIGGSFVTPEDAETPVPEDDLFGSLSGDIAIDAAIGFSDFNVPIDIQAPEDFTVFDPSTDGFGDDFFGEEGSDEILVEKSELDNGWFQYDLPEEGLSISTPPTWTTFPLDAESVDAIIAGLEAENPELAERIGDDLREFQSDGTFKLYGYDSDAPDDTLGSTNFNILREDIGFPLDLATLSELSIQQIPFFVDVSGDIESESLELPAGEAVRLSYLITPVVDTGIDDEIAVIQYMLLQDTNSIVITFSTFEDMLDESIPMFDEIIDTLELFEPLASDEFEDESDESDALIAALDFELPLYQSVFFVAGDRVRFSDHFLGPVILYFWTPDCEQCIEQLQILDERFLELSDLQVIAIHVQSEGISPGDGQQMTEDLGLHMYVGYDFDNLAPERGIPGAPYMIMFGPFFELYHETDGLVSAEEITEFINETDLLGGL